MLLFGVIWYNLVQGDMVDKCNNKVLIIAIMGSSGVMVEEKGRGSS